MTHNLVNCFFCSNYSFKWFILKHSLYNTEWIIFKCNGYFCFTTTLKTTLREKKLLTLFPTSCESNKVLYFALYEIILYFDLENTIFLHLSMHYFIFLVFYIVFILLYLLRQYAIANPFVTCLTFSNSFHFSNISKLIQVKKSYIPQ